VAYCVNAGVLKLGICCLTQMSRDMLDEDRGCEGLQVSKLQWSRALSPVPVLSIRRCSHVNDSIDFLV